jgi:hypothetical protein
MEIFQSVFTRSSENLTSSALNDAPLLNLTPWRSWKS